MKKLSSRDRRLGRSRELFRVRLLGLCGFRLVVIGDMGLRGLARIGSENATETLLGIQSVLSGSRQTYEAKYASPASSEPKWLRTTAMRLPGAKGRALISPHQVFEERQLISDTGS